MLSRQLSAKLHLNKLKDFRQEAYALLGCERDTLFELCDAVLLTPALNAFAELSLCPAFRRQWPSLYKALQRGRPDRTSLVQLYMRHLPTEGRWVFAGDHTAWPRLSAPTLRERTVEHQPNKIPAAKPITVGLGFSTLVAVPEAQGSWALPLLHERITPEETPCGKMKAQLAQVCQYTPQRPLVMLDAEYGNAPFVKECADVPCDLLFRLRPNLRLYTAPGPYQGNGRPRKHGRAFKLRDARTWGKPTETLDVDDPELGHVHVSLYTKLHFEKAADQPLWVVHIERPQARGTRRDPRSLWVAWVGQAPPPLADWWKQYLRRFVVDHWYRFLKQRLYWTLPHLKTPEQAECWSDLMPLITWQLWLARPITLDKPLPWQKPQARLSPGRVRQSLGAVLSQISTPTCAPKRRGKSLGWPTGRVRRMAPRYRIVKKSKKRAR